MGEGVYVCQLVCESMCEHVHVYVCKLTWESMCDGVCVRACVMVYMCVS